MTFQSTTSLSTSTEYNKNGWRIADGWLMHRLFAPPTRSFQALRDFVIPFGHGLQEEDNLLDGGLAWSKLGLPLGRPHLFDDEP